MSYEKNLGPVAQLRRFKPYPAYKDSGVEWLGDIPGHWRHLKIKYSTYVKGRIGWQNLRNDEFTDEGPYCVTGTDFIEGRVDWARSYHVCKGRYEQDPFIQLRRGDLLVTKDGSIGKLALVDDLPGPACLNSGVFATRPLNDRYSPEYLYWVLSSEVFTAFIDYMSAGSTIQHLYQYIFGTFVFPSPSASEQRAIVTFLDRETAKIDGLITKKEWLIELLQEKRTALITRAVTKGLDPNVPMKDSGVEWLGEIPRRWEVVRVKYTLKDRVSGPFGSSLTKDSYGGDAYRVYGQEQVIPGDFTVGDYYIPEAKFRSMARYAVAAGDVLLSCVGTFGRAVVVPEGIQPGVINPRLILLRPDRGAIVPAYLELFLKSGLSFGQLDQITRGGTMDIINLSTISALVMPLPPKAEQAEILGDLRNENSRIDALIARIRDAIDRLKELRTALISAAVTGKIDVREEVT